MDTLQISNNDLKDIDALNELRIELKHKKQVLCFINISNYNSVVYCGNNCTWVSYFVNTFFFFWYYEFFQLQYISIIQAMTF